MSSLSVCMIVKNEEKLLEQALNSVKSIADEIIIVDTGSADKTKELAKKFTKNIFDFKWGNDFSAARNESLKHATKDWILVIDADELISESDTKKILDLAKKLEGWVSVNFAVELDGTITNVESTIQIDRILSDEVIKAVQSSPKWDPPKNPDVDEPITSGIMLKFKLPDQILNEPPFVVVEQMPSYPGGDIELLNFIKNNTKYPEEANAEKIQGRVIVRFIVSTEGNAEGISVLKGVHPLLDAEAIRVAGMLKGWKPGMQGGKPVNVWYMAPVTFSLPEPEKAIPLN